jgi:hypothetical protein
MTKEKGFIYQAHCSDGYPSSKRFWGGIGFAICQLCIIAATVLSFVHTHELSGMVSSLIDFDLAVSAALLGLESITRMFGNNRTSIGKPKNETEE